MLMKVWFRCAVVVAMTATVLPIAPAAAFPPAKTKVIRGGEPAQTLAVNITGAKDLYLVAHIGPDTYNSDQAIWAEPRVFDKAGHAVDLTTLKPTRTQVGWGEFVVNQAHGDRPLTIAGKTFAKGFYAHAPSVLYFKLDGSFTHFEAQVGIFSGSGKNGSVEFEVTGIAPKITAPQDRRLPPPPVAARISPAGKAPHKFNPAAAEQLLHIGIEKLLFVRRHTLTCSHVYTEFIDARWTPGGGLCLLDLKTGSVTDLLPAEFSTGVVNRFDVSFDAKRILFDFKCGAKEGYRIYEIGIDGKNLRQLTFPEHEDAELLRRYGYGTNDMHPCYLSDGNIMFTSTRCRASTLCHGGDLFTTPVLHRMDAGGKNIHRLSNNCVSEFSPAVLPDGRVLYMRWEYNRKGAGAVKCLWAMLPDGTATSEVYGNLIVDPETMLYGRPIPGSSQKICFLGCSHWGPNNGVGTVVVLDTTKDTASREAMTFVTKDVNALTHGGFSFLVDGKWVHESTGTPGRLFKDPYPLSESLFLVAQKPKGLTWHDPKGYDLSLLDEEGRETLLYRDEEVSCWHPYPLRPRPLPPVPATSLEKDLTAKNLAQCVVADVYRGLDGVSRGSVKYLRIMEQTPRPWTARNRWKGDQQGMAHTAMGYHLLGMQAQYGVVPVEDDGSANFYVPAGRNIYFQALDENFMAIQTERTYVNYMPGETRSCVGCHHRSHTPSAGRIASSAKALLRRPSVPGPQPGDRSGEKLFDYARQIQPIWDRYCLECHHDKPEAAAGLSLVGTPTDLYSVSYENLLGKGKKYKPSMQLIGFQADENNVRGFVEYTHSYHFGAYSSVLAAIFGNFEPHFVAFEANAGRMADRVKKLREQHRDVKLSPDEFVRIVNWLDSSCQYHPSYWGMKHVAHAPSPYFRPAVSFREALGDRWPTALRALYDPGPQ